MANHEKVIPSKPKVDLEIVRASLNTTCPNCGRLITPGEIRRVDSERMECPQCGARFIPAQNSKAKMPAD
jgi:predicted RNA-binding Zn-ribbon protein involved in translation (DUF1610 family)